jgi:hypothetical protein
LAQEDSDGRRNDSEASRNDLVGRQHGSGGRRNEFAGVKMGCERFWRRRMRDPGAE